VGKNIHNFVEELHFLFIKEKNSNTSTRGWCNHKLHQQVPCNSFLPIQGEFTPKNPNDKLVKRQPKCNPILADTNPKLHSVKEEEGDCSGESGPPHKAWDLISQKSLVQVPYTTTKRTSKKLPFINSRL
jgi:hypothetical protein